MEHLEKYLRLEKLRFGDELEIVYDIQIEDFMLPTLSVQPLIENAVKRLGMMMNAGLEIESKKGVGTTACIRITKRRDE